MNNKRKQYENFSLFDYNGTQCMWRIKLWFRLFEWGHMGHQTNIDVYWGFPYVVDGFFFFFLYINFGWISFRIRDIDKDKNCFASIVCIRKYYFIYFRRYIMSWKVSIVWKLVQKFIDVDPREFTFSQLFWSWIIFLANDLYVFWIDLCRTEMSRFC